MPEKSKEIWYRYRGDWPFVYPWPVHWKGLVFQFLPVAIIFLIIDFLPFQVAGIAAFAVFIASTLFFYIFMRRHSEPDNN